MKDGWLDLVSISLVGAVVVLACVDFLLGKQGRRSLQLALETLWLRLSYIRWPTLGTAEAEAFIRWFDRAFGPRLFSIRRLVVTTLCVAALVTLAYVVYEGVRLVAGKEVRWPFVAPHWATGFPVQVLPAMVSISITRLLVVSSLYVVKQVGGGTPLFLLAIGSAGYLSSALSLAVAFSFEPILWAIDLSTQAAVDYILDKPTDYDHAYFRWFPLFWSKAMIGISLTKLAITHPILAFSSFHSLAQHNDVGLVRVWYDFAVSLGIGGIRIAFAAAFIGSWLFLRPLRWLTSLVVLRLAEAERGALTILGAGLAVLAKLIHEYMKR